MASNGEEVDVRGEVVDLLLEKIASDRNPSVTMMNLVEELLAPDDVPAYAAVLMDKVKTERYPSLAMLRRLIAFAS
jgi:hypothetical protein